MRFISATGVLMPFFDRELSQVIPAGAYPEERL
jgi:hypothetical protein